MKVLFLCNKSPWPPREGGPMAMTMFAEGLADAGHRVKVLAVNSYKYHITPADIPDEYRAKTSIELIEADLRVRPLPALIHLFTGKSYHVQRFISASFRRRLEEVLTAEDFDIVQLETVFMAPYADVIRKLTRAKIVLRAHNIEHRIWERLARECRNPLKKWYLGHLARTLRNYECSVVNSLDGIVAITPVDAAFFRRILTTPVPVADIPFGIRPDEYDPGPGKPEPPALFSIGSMDWMPNQQGIRWFLDEVWPGLHRRHPQVRYHLAGRRMPDWMQSLTLPGVVVEGEVPDARAFMSGKPVMVVPLFSGSGIRVKIIEGMAAGRTIVSTAVGAEGIRCTPGEHLLVADDAAGFARAIERCMTDPSECLRLGIRARRLIEQEYDAGKLTAELIAFYNRLGD